jgi:hypothetical protein
MLLELALLLWRFYLVVASQGHWQQNYCAQEIIVLILPEILYHIASLCPQVSVPVRAGFVVCSFLESSLSYSANFFFSRLQFTYTLPLNAGTGIHYSGLI